MREKCATLPPSTYFVGCAESSLIKIGWAADPVVRLGCLQTGSPVRLRIVSILPGPRSGERALHERFKHLRADGEWFLCEVGNELHQFIESATYAPDTLFEVSPPLEAVLEEL